MTEHEQIMAAALAQLQRKVKIAHVRGTIEGETLIALLCTECGRTWLQGAPEEHWPTCATGIARAARVACGREPC